MLDGRLRQAYLFSDEQYGFQPGRGGAEQDLPRVRRMYAEGKNKAVILDLKSAYQSVVRSKLMLRVDEKLPQGLAAQAQAMLSTNLLQTVGDDTKNVEEMCRGAQRIPLSPSLFNLYIDTLAER